MDGNKTEIDFVLVGKSNGKYIKDVKEIPWQLQHSKVEKSIEEQINDRRSV